MDNTTPFLIIFMWLRPFLLRTRMTLHNNPSWNYSEIIPIIEESNNDQGAAIQIFNMTAHDAHPILHCSWFQTGHQTVVYSARTL